jgi:hypothetical protein
MSSPFYQDVHQSSGPPPITPADTPSSPEDYAAVTPHGRGPAPYDIQASLDDLSGMTAAAGAVTGAGVVYPVGPRQRQIEGLLMSPQGYGDFDVPAGFSGGGGDTGWPNDVTPGG